MAAELGAHIRITASGAEKVEAQARSVASAFNAIGGASASSMRSVAVNADRANVGLAEVVRRAHLYVGAMTLIAQVQKAVAEHDSFVGLRSRLDQLSGSARAGAQAMQAIQDIAQRQGAALGEVGSAYVRVGNAIKVMGGGAAETAKIVETVGAALRLNNATTAEASSVMLQFGQAMAKGRVNGDEFSSLMENAPTLMDAVAESLGKTKGQLYEMAQAGELTSAIFGSGVLRSFDKLTTAAQAMPRTVGQAMQSMANSFKIASGESSALSAVATTAIGGLALAGRNAVPILNALTIAVGAVSAVMLGRLVAGSVAAVAASRAVAVAKAAEAASWNAVTASIGTYTVAQTALVRGASGLLALLGGPVGITAALVAGALAWAAYYAASAAPGKTDQFDSAIERLRQQKKALDENNEALQTASTLSARQEKLREIKSLEADGGRRIATRFGVVIDKSALSKARADLVEFDQLVASTKKAAESVDLKDKQRPLNDLLDDLPTREKAVKEYTRRVKDLTASANAEIAALAKNPIVTFGARDAIVDALNSGLAAAQKDLNEAQAKVGADDRATAAASAKLALQQEEASADARIRTQRRLQDALEADNAAGLVSLNEYAEKKQAIEESILAQEVRIARARLAAANAAPARHGAGGRDEKQAEIAALQAQLDALRERNPGALSEAAFNRLDASRTQATLAENAQRHIAARDSAIQAAQEIATAARDSNLMRIKDDRERGEKQIDIERQTALARIAALGAGTPEYIKAVDDLNALVLAKQQDLNESLKPAFQRMLESWQDNARLMAETFDRTLTGGIQAAEDAFVQFALTGKLSIKSLADTVIAETARMLARKGLAELFKLFAGGGNMTEFNDGMAGNFARGGVFSPAGQMAFAAGGIVTSAQPFAFAQGGQLRRGLMGEAGPEAIIPLKRGADGSLGVASTGGGSGVSYVINVAGDATAQTMQMLESALARFEQRQHRARMGSARAAY